MLKTTSEIQSLYEKKLLKTRQKILLNFNKMDYIKMDKLINDCIRYNTLLGLTRRTQTLKRTTISNSFNLPDSDHLKANFEPFILNDK